MQSDPLPPVSFNPQSFVPSAFSESPDNRWDVSFLSFHSGSLAGNTNNGNSAANLVTDASSDASQSSFDDINPLGVTDSLVVPPPTQQEFLQSVLAPSVVSVPSLGTPAAASDNPSGPDFSLNMLGQNSPHIMGILQKFFSQPFVPLPDGSAPQSQPHLPQLPAASPAPNASAPNGPAAAPMFPFVIVPTLLPQTTTLSVTPQGSWTNLTPAPNQLAAASPAHSSFTANLSPVSNDNASVTQSSGSSDHGEDSPRSGTRKRGGRAILDVNAWEERRQKHNEIESQRRAQLNTSYEKLQTLVRSADPGKSAILRATVDVLKNYEKKVKELEQTHQAKRRKVQEIEAKKAEQALAQKIPVLPAPSDASSGLSLSVPRPLDSGARLGPNNNAHWNGGVEHFKAFLHSGVAMHVALMNGQIVDCNEKFEELLSNKKAMISQLSVFTITHPAFVPKCYNMMNNLITGTTEIESGQEVIVDCTGSIVSVHVTCWVVREEGKPKYIMAVVVPLEAKRKTGFAVHHDVPQTQDPRPIPSPQAIAGASQTSSDVSMVPVIKSESASISGGGCSGSGSSIEVLEDSH